MAQATPQWSFSGDYFENCNCDFVCPCLMSTGAPLTAKPTRGACEAAVAFHIDQGRFGDVALNGLNTAAMIRWPGPLGEGNGSVALYVDERGDQQQRDALQAIFSGAAGGVMGLFAPLISTVLGVKPAAVNYRQDGKRRSVEIPGVLYMAVRPAQSIREDSEMMVANYHPFNFDGVAFAVGEPGNTWSDYGMKWDNSGQSGHYAPIKWSNA